MYKNKSDNPDKILKILETHIIKNQLEIENLNRPTSTEIEQGIKKISQQRKIQKQMTPPVNSNKYLNN